LHARSSQCKVQCANYVQCVICQFGQVEKNTDGTMCIQVQHHDLSISAKSCSVCVCWPFFLPFGSLTFLFSWTGQLVSTGKSKVNVFLHHVCRLSPRRSAVVRTAPRCCASLRSTSCRSAVLRLVPLRSSAPRCCTLLPPLRLAAPRSAPLWCCKPLPPLRAAALCSAPLRRFARIQCRPGINPGLQC
jgi:hypothetical protein